MANDNKIGFLNLYKEEIFYGDLNDLISPVITVLKKKGCLKNKKKYSKQTLYAASYLRRLILNTKYNGNFYIFSQNKIIKSLCPHLKKEKEIFDFAMSLFLELKDKV
ncbi:MAG: hypothetical protein ACOC1P_03725 [Minisyncoccales bacterium]